jgi:hypothetical protein
MESNNLLLLLPVDIGIDGYVAVLRWQEALRPNATMYRHQHR